MSKLYNLAKMTTATTGAGTITLLNAVNGFLTFAEAGVQDGDTVTYAIRDGNEREIGRGVYTASGTTLTRSVLRSTNSNSPISLSGNAQVFITAAAEDMTEATVAQVRSAATNKKLITTELLETACAIVALATGTSHAPDWDAFIIGEITANGAFTLNNPTSVQPGTSRTIYLKGNYATERTISFGSNYKGNLPSQTVTSTSWLMLVLTAYSTTHIVVTSARAL